MINKLRLKLEFHQLLAYSSNVSCNSQLVAELLCVCGQDMNLSSLLIPKYKIKFTVNKTLRNDKHERIKHHQEPLAQLEPVEELQNICKYTVDLFLHMLFV